MNRASVYISSARCVFLHLQALDVMCTVARRTELGMESSIHQYPETMPFGRKNGINPFVGSERRTPATENLVVSPHCSMPIQDVASKELSEIMAYNAVSVANTMQAPIVVFTRKGRMPALLSHFCPQHSIFCFSDNERVQQRLGIYKGVTAFVTEFCSSAESTFDRALQELKSRGFIREGQLVVLVQSGAKPIWESASLHSVQIRQAPQSFSRS